MTSATEIAWLAGILEGEGCFDITRTGGVNRGIRIQLQMTDEDVICKVQRVTCLGYTHGPRIFKTNRKPMYMWYVGNRDDVASILMTIYPLMGQRRQARIRELLSIWKSIPKGVCRKGHDKQGLDHCKICKRENQINRRNKEKYYV